MGSTLGKGADGEHKLGVVCVLLEDGRRTGSHASRARESLTGYHESDDSARCRPRALLDEFEDLVAEFCIDNSDIDVERVQSAERCTAR